jgi:hypothetical protein
MTFYNVAYFKATLTELNILLFWRLSCLFQPSDNTLSLVCHRRIRLWPIGATYSAAAPGNDKIIFRRMVASVTLGIDASVITLGVGVCFGAACTAIVCVSIPVYVIIIWLTSGLNTI